MRPPVDGTRVALDELDRVLATQERILVRLLDRPDAPVRPADPDDPVIDHEVARLVDDLRHNDVVRALVADAAASRLGLCAGATLADLAAACPEARTRLLRRREVLGALSAAWAVAAGRDVSPPLADFLR